MVLILDSRLRDPAGYKFPTSAPVPAVAFRPRSLDRESLLGPKGRAEKGFSAQQSPVLSAGRTLSKHFDAREQRRAVVLPAALGGMV